MERSVLPTTMNNSTATGSSNNYIGALRSLDLLYSHKIHYKWRGFLRKASAFFARELK